jgi:hypothetical protein
MAEKILFCFDTNTLDFGDNKLESFDEFSLKLIPDLIDFLEKNNLSDNILILIPETVISELNIHKEDKLKKWFQVMSDYCSNLKKINEAKVILDKFDIKVHLEELKKIVFENYEIIPLPNDIKSLFNETYSRSINKIPPFRKENSDAGFKDCIIYLSLLEYAKNYGEVDVYFFSKDKGFVESDAKSFLEDEFKERTTNNLIIKDTNDFLGVCKEIFKIDMQINTLIQDKIIPELENEISNLNKIIVDDEVYSIKEIEINSEDTMQKDLGTKIELTFYFDLKYIISDTEEKSINDLCKILVVDKKNLEQYKIFKNYNYEVLE